MSSLQKSSARRTNNRLFHREARKAPIQDSSLSQYLGITDEEWDEMGAELNANTGSSDEMTYYYWFTVPDGTPDDILEKTGWEVDQTIDDIPVWVVDVDESPCH